jgi:hypothetical protein
MSFNGSGTFAINSTGQPVVSGTVISSSTFNALTADLATGLSTCITKDGQTTVTANIPMNSYKITGLAAGTAATDAARVGQLQAGGTTLVTVAGTDTYTGTMSPSLGAYAAGNVFTFVVPNTNTTASTLNIDGLGAKALTRDGSTALVAGDLVANAEVAVVYDGTRFQVLNSNSKTNFNLSGTLTVAGNTTLSGGTANGVAYLNASKVLTTGSALTFDGTNLGVGSYRNVSGFNRAITLDVPTSGNGAYEVTYAGTVVGTVRSDSGTYEIRSGATDLILNANPSGNNAIVFKCNFNAEGMRLTSTGLGIGTSSPSYKLDVSATGTISGRVKTSGALNAFYMEDAGTTAGTLYIGSVGNDWRVVTGSNERMRIDSSGNVTINAPSSGASLTAVNGDSTVSVNAKATSGQIKLHGYHSSFSGAFIQIRDGSDSAYAPLNISASTVTLAATGGSAILDSSGNLGLGVTPAAWNANSMQIAGNIGFTVAGNFTANAYFNSGFKYTTSGSLASTYQQASGVHTWSTAPSGTAGNAITFTQAMTLDASGNLLVGATSAGFLNVWSCALRANGNGDLLVNHPSGAASGTAYAQFGYNGASIGSITQSGTAAVLYNVTSDRRLKDNITDADSASDLIDAIKVRQFDWKSDGSHQRYGMIAQELHEVAPEAVHSPADPDNMMAVDYSKLVPMLVKEIQSLRVRLNALENK